MKTVYSYTTPKGTFASAAQAAAAHGIERSTVLQRCKSRPDEYKKVLVRVRSNSKSAPTRPRSTSMPSWTEYRILSYDDKEQIYNMWCQSQGLTPDEESTANAFFDEMERLQQASP